MGYIRHIVWDIFAKITAYIWKIWEIFGKNYGIYWSIGYIKPKLRDILGKIMEYIRLKLWDILCDIFDKKPSGIVDKTMGYTGQLDKLCKH